MLKGTNKDARKRCQRYLFKFKQFFLEEGGCGVEGELPRRGFMVL